MSEERHARVVELFLAATEISPDERVAYLQRECAGDAELHAQVLEMLAVERNTPGFLEGSVANELQQAESKVVAELPEHLGRFRILERIARGGMGSVYLALQENPARNVALKVLHLDASDPRSRARFELEGELLAKLSHPGIAQIVEAGAVETEHGLVSYFAMEYVQGQDLLTHAEQQDLDQTARVALLIQVAEAVQHAHERGVVHRDLKPANILVDDRGQPRVLDFGIARVTDAELARATLETLPGQILGTLRYMSPEQASGRHDEVDTRSDIYSLGVILYELLVHQAPYDVESTSLPEALRTICEVEPMSMASLGGGSAYDLEVITRKALAKEKARRYSSAGELANDLRRALQNEPIHARPASRLYVLRRLIRRNRTASIATALAVVTLIGSFLGILFLLLHSEKLRRAESYQRYVANLAVLGTSLESGQLQTTENLLPASPPEYRGWEWHHYHLTTQLAERTIQAHRRIQSAALSGDGSVLVTADLEGEIARWNVQSGVLISRHPREMERRVDHLAVDTAGDQVLACGPSFVDYLNGTTGKRTELRAETGATKAARGAAFSLDARQGTIVRLSGQIETWDLAQGRLLYSVPGEVRSVNIVAQGPEALWIAGRSSLIQWDLLLEVEAWRVPVTVPITAVAADALGEVVAIGDQSGRIQVLDGETGETVAEIEAHLEAVTALGMSEDGSLLTSGSWPGALRVWDPRTGKLANTIPAHEGKVGGAFFAGTDRVITTGLDGRIRWWDRDARVVQSIPGSASARAAFSGNGRWLVSLQNRRLVVRDARTGAALWDRSSVSRFAVLPARDEVAVGLRSDLSVHELSSGRRVRTARLDGEIVALWSANKGHRLLVRRANNMQRKHTMWPTNLEILDSEDLQRLHEWENHALAVLAEDGETLLVQNQLTENLDAVDLNTDERQTLRGRASSLSGHPQLPLLAVGDWDGSIQIWDTRERHLARKLPGHPGQHVQDFSFHPTDHRLASGAEDGKVKIWDLTTGELLAELRLELDYGRDSGSRFWVRGIESVDFSADGHRLVVGCRDGSIRIFETRLDQARAFWKGQREQQQIAAEDR